MKVTELKYGITHTFEVKAETLDDKAFKALKAKEACQVFDQHGNAFLKQGKLSTSISGTKPSHEEALEKAIQHRPSSIFWISKTLSKKKTILLQRHTFSQYIKLGEPVLEIGLTDLIEDDIKNRFLTKNKRKIEVLGWLTNQLIVEFDEKKMGLVVSSGPRQKGLKDAFRIHGKRINLDVKRNEKGQLETARITNATKRQKAPLSFIENAIKFENLTTVGILKKGIEKELQQITTSGESYIKLWEEYNELEIKGYEKKAKQIGHVQYSKSEAISDKEAYVFSLVPQNFPDWIRQLEEENMPSVAAGESIPLFFNDVYVEEDKQEEAFIGEIIEVNKNRKKITLRPLRLSEDSNDTKPPDTGFLWYSLLGDRIRTQRRTKAAEAIRTGNIPMPQLCLILENKQVPTVQYRKLKAMTPSVKRSFRHTPNPMQQEAMNIALNTPDIALIQGPPGTGKTQVITALCSRLVEDAKAKGKDISHSILLTAFQHDAVSNMAARASPLGLPTIKIAPKADEIDPIEKWTKETIVELGAKVSQLPQSPLLQLKQSIAQQYIDFQKNRNKDAKEYLQKVYDTAQAHLAPQLCEAFLNTLKGAAQLSKEETEKKMLLKAIHGLRTNAIAFEDDGDIKISKLKRRLKDIQGSLEKDEEVLLDRLEYQKQPSNKDLQKLENLKGRLLDTYNTNALQKLPSIPKQEVDKLLTAAIDELNQLAATQTPTLADVLSEYKDDIENHPERLRNSLRNYQTALAATVQQSDGKKLYNLLDKHHKAFDTIIVDEAARANPLDLFIALTRGERRIVLVGDHRQLPHLLEKDVEKELAQKYEEEEKGKTGKLDYEEAIQKSLFERFFMHLKQLEAQDGVQRTITLSTQYRMHPVIGNFVSEVFYEAYNDTKIKSGLEAKDRLHPYPEFKGKAMAWIDIPIKMGKEIKHKSVRRPAEAKLVMNWLKKLRDQDPKMTIGVITFYSKQVEELQKAGLQHGFTKMNDEGDYEISRRYKYIETEDGEQEEGLRIGSVDAFQGKEFDVVILSMTRSNRHPTTQPRKKYGFLTLENRLNVATSRAKRLLIVVGDSGMVTCEGAEQAVYGLVKFYEKTGTHDGIRL